MSSNKLIQNRTGSHCHPEQREGPHAPQNGHPERRPAKSDTIGRPQSKDLYPVHLTSTPPSALRTQPPKNQLALPNHSLAKRTRGRTRHVVPINVLHTAAVVTDEVVVAHALQIESPGAPLDSHFPHQSRPH